MADKSVVNVYPLHRNALPWPKSSRSTGYTFSQTALNKDEMGGRGFRHGTEGDVLVEGNQAAVVFDRKGEQVEVGEMFGTKDSNMIEMVRVADAQHVCPKGMIGMFVQFPRQNESEMI